MFRLIHFYIFLIAASGLGYAQKPLSLEEAWSLVIENHELVKSLELSNYQAELAVRRTVSEIFPKIGASASVTYSNPSKDVEGSRIVPTSFRTAGVNVSQSLLDFRFRPALRGAKYAREATCHETEFQLYELLYETSEVYLAVLQTSELVRVAENQLDLASHQLRVAQERYEAGEVPITDLLRTEEEVNSAQRALQDLQTDLQVYRDHLSNMTGVETSCYVLALPVFSQMEESLDLCELIVEAGMRRQDLQSLAASIEGGKEQVRILKRTNWPKVDFQGEYVFASPETLSFRNNSWSAGFWLTLPLFEGGVNRIDVKTAVAELEKQQLLYERMAKELSVQVKSAYYEWQSAQANFSLLESALDLARENYEILSERYKHGQTSNIDLLDALNAYIQAQADFTNAQYNLVLLSIKLKKETGFFGEFLKHNGVICS